MRSFIFTALLLAMLAGFPNVVFAQSCRFLDPVEVGVIDGDTVVTSTEGRIRLRTCNAPELSRRATERLRFFGSAEVVAKRSNVKSRAKSATTDAHERAKVFLDEAEMERLLAAARTGRHGVRDHLLLLMMYRHGLRVSEAIGLRWEHVNLERARLWVERLKGSLSVEHPITGDELRLVRKHLAGRDNQLPWLFVSERGAPLSRHAVNYLIASAGDRAGLGHVHPHMLRHSCGYALADKGTDLRTMQDYLGHRDPAMTVRYTRITGRRFEGLW